MQEEVMTLIKKIHNFRVLFGDEVTEIFLSQMLEALEAGVDFIPQGVPAEHQDD